jgi:hypothetical protein
MISANWLPVSRTRETELHVLSHTNAQNIAQCNVAVDQLLGQRCIRLEQPNTLISSATSPLMFCFAEQASGVPQDHAQAAQAFAELVWPLADEAAV